MIRSLRLALAVLAAAVAPSTVRSQACTGIPLAIAGEDVSLCTPTFGSTDTVLSGARSQPNVANGPIVQFCWTTDLGIFVESGTATACSTLPSRTLRLANRPGRQVARVRLDCTDLAGCVGSDDVVVIAETAPILQRAEPTLVPACIGQPVELVAQAADTFFAQGLLTYTWDFNLDLDTDLDGGADNDADAVVVGVSGQITVVSFTPLRAGLSPARLTIRGEGSECVVSTLVTFARDEPPTIGILTAETAICPDQPTRFHAEVAPFGPRGTLSWDFDTSVDADGDGIATNDEQATGSDAEWIFGVGGARTIRVNARAAGGCVGHRDLVLDIRPRAVAAFSATGPGCGLLAVTFRDTSGAREPVQAMWDFGDGTPAEFGTSRTHVFQRAGTYAVTESIVDANGCGSTTTRMIEVGPNALRIEGVAILDGAPGSGTSGNENGFADPGERVRLVVTVRNAGPSTATGGEVLLSLVGDAFGVSISDEVASLPAIAPGGTATTMSPHLEVTLSGSAPCGTSVPLRLSASGFVDGSCTSTRELGLRIGAPAVAAFGGESRFTATPGPDVNPATAAGGDIHGVVYEAGGDLARRIHFERRTSSGLSLAPPLRVDASGDTASAPRIAWNGDARQFGVAWLETGSGSRRAMFRRVSDAGGPISAPLRLDGFGNASSVDTAWTGSGWIVAFVDRPIGGSATAWAQFLTPEGLPLGAITRLDLAGSSHSFVRVAAGSGTWAVALVRSGASAEVVVEIRDAGGIGGALASVNLGSAASEPAAITSLSGAYICALSVAGRIDVARLSAAGLLSREIAGFGLAPALAAGLDLAIVIWQDGADIVARVVATNGETANPQAIVSTAAGLARSGAISASSDGLFLAVWADDRAAHPDDLEIYGQVLQTTAGAGCLLGVIGDIAPQPNGDGRVDISDVVLALRVAVLLDALTADILARGDVAPGERIGRVHFVIGDRMIDIGDVVVLLQASVGEITLQP